MKAVRHYYIDDYVDEGFCPAVTLEGWATWLAAPKPDDYGQPRSEPATEGEQFSASVLDVTDIAVRREGDGWVHAEPPGDASFFAVRFGPGFGWDSDSIADTLAAALDWALESLPLAEDIIVACGVERPRVRLEYRVQNGAPTLVEIGALQ